jgi:hypothetical protein
MSTRKVPATEKEARAAITLEHFRGYRDRWSGRWIPPLWELRTPDGWCWDTDRHLNCCFSAAQATRERASEPIERCEPDCSGCGTESFTENEVQS